MDPQRIHEVPDITLAGDTVDPIIGDPATKRAVGARGSRLSDAAGAHAAEPGATSQAARGAALGGAIAAAAVVIGSFGMWATLNMTLGGGSVELGGVRGTSGDGWITLGLGVLAGVALLARAFRPTRRRWLGWTAAAALALAAAAGGYDWQHIHRVAAANAIPGFDYGVRAGWGLMVVTLGGLAGLGLALASALMRPRAVAARAEPTGAAQPAFPEISSNPSVRVPSVSRQAIDAE